MGWDKKSHLCFFFRSYSHKSRLPNHLNYLDKIWTCEALSESPVIARKFTKKNEVPPELLSLEVRGYPPTGETPLGLNKCQDEDVKAEKERVQQVDPRKQVQHSAVLYSSFSSRFPGA